MNDFKSFFLKEWLLILTISIATYTIFIAYTTFIICLVIKHFFWEKNDDYWTDSLAFLLIIIKKLLFLIIIILAWIWVVFITKYLKTWSF